MVAFDLLALNGAYRHAVSANFATDGRCSARPYALRHEAIFGRTVKCLALCAHRLDCMVLFATLGPRFF
jgi:hypothetical protein